MLITPPPPPPPPKKKLWLPIVTDSAGSPSTSSRYPCNQHHLYLEKDCPTSTRTSKQAKCTQSFSETIIETSDGIAYHNIKQ
ncbi:unnamed protein product [Rhizophagus irregularis]|nr:unnamed protein product [Rhizophagus irregularis]